jgi:CheY-like chemotaxis protein
MDLASLTVSFAGPPSIGEQITQVIGAAPALIAALVLLYVVVRLRDTLPAIVARLTDVEAFGLKLSLSGGQAMSAAVEMARKNPHWEGEAPVADQHRALARALRERKLLDGAEILWVDDCPSNNRNEARMLRSFGVMITFACTTEEALTALHDGDEQKQPFDMIISDIDRDYPTPNPRAGLDMLPRLAEAGHRETVVFYVGRLNRNAGVPPGAFGITNRPDELLNLTLDALVRVRAS